MISEAAAYALWADLIKGNIDATEAVAILLEHLAGLITDE